MHISMRNAIERHASQGQRIFFTPAGEEKRKRIWAGLGNRAGLHSFQYELLSEKWQKSGKRFMAKVDKLGPGEITIQQFVNTTRDRGRWETFYTETVKT